MEFAQAYSRASVKASSRLRLVQVSECSLNVSLSAFAPFSVVLRRQQHNTAVQVTAAQSQHSNEQQMLSVLDRELVKHQGKGIVVLAAQLCCNKASRLTHHDV